MKISDWVTQKLEENNYDKAIVRTKYNECCKDLNKDVNIHTFDRSIRKVYNKHFKHNDNIEPVKQTDSQGFKNIYEQTNDTIRAERLFTRNPQSLEDVMEMFDVDSNIWECEKFTCSTWDVTSTKAGKTATNIAVKAVFKKRKELINMTELAEIFKDNIKGYIPPPIMINTIDNNYVNLDNLLEIPLVDLHLGKLGWKAEVGVDYDHKIVSELFKYIIENTIHENMKLGFGRILTLVGNDALNFDNTEGGTTKGTRQDNDLRWKKMFSVAMNLFVWGIDYMANYAPVDVMWIPGNHDSMASYFLGCYLSAWYKDSTRVNIDISPKVRKFYEFGNNLIGYSHGDRERKRIDGIMQVEAREQWGRTLFHEWHLGHLHSEQTREEHGIIFRNISSITGPDAWHYESGYIGALRKSPSYLWNRNNGMIAQVNTVINTNDIKDLI